MARKFNELRRKMSPERQRRNKDEADRVLLEMSLQQLRQRVADLAEASEVTQGYISKLERHADMLVSKLYAYVEALGLYAEVEKLPSWIRKKPNKLVQSRWR